MQIEVQKILFQSNTKDGFTVRLIKNWNRSHRESVDWRHSEPNWTWPREVNTIDSALSR